MYTIAKETEENRRILFRNTARAANLNEAIIEKDFWVCLVLDYLFHNNQWKSAFTFKGGTSLSKCYGLINRFSEDIDVILDWRALGYDVNEPWQSRTYTKQDKFNKDANQRAEKFIRDDILPVLKNDIKNIIGSPADIYIDESDPQTICFRYPSIFKSESILQIIRLEIGALAAWTPAKKRSVTPYAAQYYPHIFSKANTVVLTTSAERTFWEKVTILHHEANRPQNLSMPLRYSRHYYDLYCIAYSDSKTNAIHNLDLLQQVVDFKMKFYPRKWAQYEEAIPGTIKLVPPTYRFDDLQKDYEAMSEMMFGEYPSFSQLMAFIENLEDEINALKTNNHQ